MTDEQRAAEAKQILNNPVFKDAMQALEATIIEKIATCDTSDEKTLRALTGILQSSRVFKSMLSTWVTLGEFEQESAKTQSTWAKRLQVFKR